MYYRNALEDYRKAHGFDGSVRPRRADVIDWLRDERSDHDYLHILKHGMSDLTLALPRVGMEECEKAIRRYCSTNTPPVVPVRWYSRDHTDARKHRRYVVMASEADMVILRLMFPELHATESKAAGAKHETGQAMVPSEGKQ